MHNEETTCPHCGKATTLDARQVRKAESLPELSKLPEHPFGTSSQPSNGIVVAGYALAFLMPIIGFFIGLYLLTTKRHQGTGIAIMILSVICASLWFVIFTM